MTLTPGTTVLVGLTSSPGELLTFRPHSDDQAGGTSGVLLAINSLEGQHFVQGQIGTGTDARVVHINLAHLAYIQEYQPT